jgi:hypothetical protein
VTMQRKHKVCLNLMSRWANASCNEGTYLEVHAYPTHSPAEAMSGPSSNLSLSLSVALASFLKLMIFLVELQLRVASGDPTWSHVRKGKLPLAHSA